MTWTWPADLRAQVQKLWDRGDLLASLVNGEALFPKRLLLKAPTSSDMAGRFDEVRRWIAELQAMPHCRVVAREFRHRVLGVNAVPHEAWIDTLEHALALIGKQRELARFMVLIEITRRLQPRLADWLARRPLRALVLAADWRLLLDFVGWLQAHPRPDIYLRQISLPGMHSKFIEAHRGDLTELLDLVLAPDAIDATAAGTSQFARRYGFRDKPVRIRFRMLDARHALLPGALGPHESGQDMTLDADTFARLEPTVTQVFMTENEINYLAFPAAEQSLIIFGAGYGFAMLRNAAWLARCRIHYWGDIDTHGFAILDQLRYQFDHVESFLMDRATLLASVALWGREDKQTLRDLPRLSADEQALFDDLRDNRLGGNVRLEQELIGFERVT